MTCVAATDHVTDYQSAVRPRSRDNPLSASICKTWMKDGTVRQDNMHELYSEKFLDRNKKNFGSGLRICDVSMKVN